MRLPFSRIFPSLAALLAAGAITAATPAFAQDGAAAGGGSGIDCSDPACKELCDKAKEGMEAQLRLTSSTVKPAESVASPQKSCFDSITSQVPDDLAAPTIKGDSLLDGILQQACDKAQELMSSITSKLGELGNLSNLDIGNLGSSGLGNIFSGASTGNILSGGGSLTDWLQNSAPSLTRNLPFGTRPGASTGGIAPTTAPAPSIMRNVRPAPQSRQGTGVTPEGGSQQQNDLINLFR